MAQFKTIRIKTLEKNYANKKINKNEMKLSINKIKPKYGCLECFDIDKDDSLFRNTLLAPFLSHKDPENSKTPMDSVSTENDLFLKLDEVITNFDQYQDMIDSAYQKSFNLYSLNMWFENFIME